MEKALPPEIWKLAFRHATEEPHGLISTWPQDSLSGNLPPSDNDIARIESIHSAAVRTKLSLILVSKTWNALALELLFEYISIKSKSALDAVASAVQRRNGGKADANHLGWFTLRINFHGDLFTEDRDNVDLASTIFEICANLRILSLSLPLSLYGENILGEAIEHCPRPCLQRLQILRGPLDPFAAIFLVQFQAMDMLSLHLNTFPASLPLPITAALPKLHTLRVTSSAAESFLEFLARCALPSLENVTTYFSSPNALAPSFFSRHGSRITYLNLAPEGSGSAHLPPRIFSYCPYVKRLVVAYPTIPTVFPAFAHLTQISLHTNTDFLRGLYRHSTANPVYDLVHYSYIQMGTLLRSHYPSLLLVRLVDFDSMSFQHLPYNISHCKDTLESWIRQWEEKGVLLEDKFGRLIELPPQFLDAARKEEEERERNRGEGIGGGMG